MLHCSLLTQNISLCQGKPLSFFHIHDIKTYPCFLVAHKTTVEFYSLGKLQRETKKSNLLKVMQPLGLSFLPFLALASSWITTREGAVRRILSNKSLSASKSLSETLHSRKEGYCSWSGRLGLTALLFQRRQTEEQRCRVESTAWTNDCNSLDSVT